MTSKPPLSQHLPTSTSSGLGSASTRMAIMDALNHRQSLIQTSHPSRPAWHPFSEAITLSIQAGDPQALRDLLVEDGGRVFDPVFAKRIVAISIHLDQADCLMALADAGAAPADSPTHWLRDAVDACLAQDAPACLLALLARPGLPRLFDPQGLLDFSIEHGKCPKCVASLESLALQASAASADPGSAFRI